MAAENVFLIPVIIQDMKYIDRNSFSVATLYANIMIGAINQVLKI